MATPIKIAGITPTSNGVPVFQFGKRGQSVTLDVSGDEPIEIRWLGFDGRPIANLNNARTVTIPAGGIYMVAWNTVPRQPSEQSEHYGLTVDANGGMKNVANTHSIQVAYF